MTRSKPNILFLLSDEHSFRFMGHLPRERGGEDVETPCLDRLARQAATFEHTYCPVPLCVPSRISLMTGLEAQRCGAINNYSVLDPTLDTLPKMMGRAGYETALVGKMHFGGSLQFHGFKHRPYGDLMGVGTHQYEDHVWETGADEPRDAGGDAEPNIGDNIVSRTALVGRSRIPESLICDRVVAEETVAFLRNHAAAKPDTPWFLCASFSRPHFPLTAPPRFADRYRAETVSPPFAPPEGASFDHPVSASIREGWSAGRIDHAEMMGARAGYFACVSYLDEILGDLLMRLEASGLLENTVIVYASDHGEMIGELGTWWKSGWYEGCCRVPMIVSLPEHRNGTLAPARFDTPVSTLDLVPTFCALAGVAPATALTGTDLTPAMTGKAALRNRPICCDHINARWGKGTEFRVVRWRNWKYVGFRGYDDLLFDLDSDPCEAVSLIGLAPLGIEEKLRSIVCEGIDYERVDRLVAEEQPRLKAAYPLDKSGAMPNQYLLPEGKLVEADTTLYASAIVSERPETLFADWPEGDGPA